jgi:hypothetical protein
LGTIELNKFYCTLFGSFNNSIAEEPQGVKHMSVWSTKSLGRDRDYVLIKHPLPGVNYTVKGVKFRDGYAVVEKDSKIYFELKKMPLLKTCKEFDLLFLRKLKFISRTIDVKYIYGEDVYRFYLQKLETQLEKEDEIQLQVEEEKHLASDLCKHRTAQDSLCKWPALDVSPSGFCRQHILDDPALKDLGIIIPQFITKKEKADVKDKVIKQLTKIPESKRNSITKQ